MVKKIGAGSAKRFGVRYGRTLKIKLAEIEEQYKRRLSCPYCHYEKVKRVASGIWKCKKCGARFTASAYSPLQKKIIEEK